MKPVKPVYKKDAWVIRVILRQEYRVVHLHTKAEARAALPCWERKMCTICSEAPPEEIKKIYSMLTLKNPDRVYWAYWHHYEE